MVHLIPWKKIYENITECKELVIQAGSVSRTNEEGLSEIKYQVSLKSDSHFHTILIHETLDSGIGGKMANEYRKHHMQFVIQTAEFLYNTIREYCLYNNCNVNVNIEFGMATPVIGLTFNELLQAIVPLNNKNDN